MPPFNLRNLLKHQAHIITSLSIPLLALREIEDQDQERLRTWKNKNRRYFFFQGLIDPKMQQDWFAKYLEDENNHLFIVEYRSQPVGCMGFKTFQEGADIYNVILGDEAFARQGIMSKALQIMCSRALQKKLSRIFLKVLTTNSEGYKWYLKNGFEHKFSEETYHFLELNLAKFEKVPIQIALGKTML